MSLVAAAETLEVSYRQMRRIFARFLTDGDAGLVHRRKPAIKVTPPAKEPTDWIPPSEHPWRTAWSRKQRRKNELAARGHF